MYTRTTLSHTLYIHSNGKINLGFANFFRKLSLCYMQLPGKGRTNKHTTVKTLYILASKYKNKFIHLIFWLLSRHVKCSEKDILEAASQSPWGDFLKKISSSTDFSTQSKQRYQKYLGLVLQWQEQVDRFLSMPRASGMERTPHY